VKSVVYTMIMEIKRASSTVMDVESVGLEASKTSSIVINVGAVYPS